MEIDYILQVARPEYHYCLSLVEGVHRHYAKMHDMEYVQVKDAPEVSGWGGWDKIPVLIDLIGRPDTGLVVWLDADVLVVDLSADPREVLGGHLIAMARHPGHERGTTTYNCGVMFVQACPQTHEWLNNVLAHTPGKHPWYEQDIMNHFLEDEQWDGLVKTLPHEWNSTVTLQHSDDCIIKAWHGFRGGPTRRAEYMKKEIEKRNLF